MKRNSDASEKPSPRKATQKPQGKSTHLPPFVIADGSLVIEGPDFSRGYQVDPGSRRPHKYKKAGDQRDILRVEVLNTRPGKDPKNVIQGLEGGKWQILIWLEEKLPNKNDYEPVLPAYPNEPQIIIKGNPPEIEIDKQLMACQPTNIPRRPCKYEIPPYSPGAHFRIGKIEAVRGNAQGPSFLLYDDRDAVRVAFYDEPPH